MRKLTELEQVVLDWLTENGPYCPSDVQNTPNGRIVLAAMHTLVRKKRAVVEMTDDGPRYHAA